MPKVNKTMLDQLASIMKASGRKKPAIIQETTIRDPLAYPLEQRHPFGRKFGSFPIHDLTPERVKYQQGIDARLFPRMRKADADVGNAYDEMDAYKDEWISAVDDAKEYMKEDWETGLDDRSFKDVDPDYLEVEAPSTNLRDYWPNDARTPDEIYSDFDDAQDRYYAAKDVQRDLRRPETRMQEQMMTPRYRNYQRAILERVENDRRGRLNAEIMHLARMGYSLPEIRAMLNGTMPTPAVGGR